jgi:NAD(P)H-hydrate repair Nnr-like enzyme with NAD(P)H-hydrate dehydratase domain
MLSAIGPGISDNEEALNLCNQVLKQVNTEIPVVLDADCFKNN